MILGLSQCLGNKRSHVNAGRFGMDMFEMAIASDYGYSAKEIADADIVMMLIEMISEYGYKKVAQGVMDFYKNRPEAQEAMKRYLIRAQNQVVWSKNA